MSRVPSRGGRGGRGRSVLVVLVAVVACASVAVPAASFTTADAPRETTVAVAEDANGVVGLDKAASVQKNSLDRLVTVTDNFGEPVTVTVSLVDGSDGSLYYDENGDGTPEAVGSSAEMSLAPDESADVYVEATDRPNSQLPYDVTGDAGDASFTLQRSTTIQGGNGNDGNGKHKECTGKKSERPDTCKNSG